jgi:hypothetical protein
MRTYRAELLRSVNRASGAFLMLCLAFTLFAVVNAGPQAQTPLWGFQQVAILTATLLMGRAAVIAANDFSTGTIRPWLISTPSRGGTFLGKLAASVTAALVVSVFVGLGTYAVSGLAGTVPGVRAMAIATGELAVASVVLSVFGHAVGMLTRSVPVALTITIAWILPAEKILQGRSDELDRWLPGVILQDMTLGSVGVGSSPLSAVLHAVVPFVLLDALALAVFLRRDVNS